MADRSILVKLRADVSDFTSKMKQASAETSNFTEKHEKSLGSMGDAGMKAGGLIVAGLTLAAGASANFEQAMSNVAATGADARNNMDELRAAAIEMGAKTAFSATEAAAGVENLLKAGVSAQDVLGGGLAGALDLAAAGELGVADAAEIASTAMTQFGLSGKDVPHIADLLAAGAGKAAGEVSDMAAALKQSGLVASQMGISIEETTGTLAAFASAGLIGSDAGTSFKTMLQRLSNPSKESAKAMADLGIAAYDTQGNFVGMTALAGQLQAAMQDLSPAQRDAAMATIFGSDAVRAASVLYQQGASGIADWIAQVNDQGYAAETAATKMDNLKGDLEALGGSFETLLIQLGSGAQGPLRGFVQGIGGAVDAVAALPAPLQQAGMMAAGTVGTLLLLGGAGIKAAIGARSLYSDFRELIPAGSKAEAGLKGVGKAAGLVAAGFAIITAGQVIQDLTNIAVSAEDAQTMLSRAAAGAGSLDGAFNGADVGINTLDDALATLGRNDWWAGLQRGFQGLAGMGGSFVEAKEGVDALDAALVRMKPDEAAAAFDKIRNSQEGQKLSAEQLAQIFPKYAASLQEASRESGKAATGAEVMADAIDGAGDAATEAAASMEDLVKGMTAYASASLALSGSQIAFEDAVDSATAAVKENGKTLDITTEKGRANRSALDGIASSALKVYEGMQQAGAGTEELGQFAAVSRQSFIDAATAMGMLPEEAARLADAYQLLPGMVNTEISADGIDITQQQADAYRQGLYAIPRDVITSILAPGAVLSKEQADAVNTAIQQIPGYTAAMLVTPGAQLSKEQVDAVERALAGVPAQTTAAVVTPGAVLSMGQADAVNAALRAIPGSTSATVVTPGAQLSKQQADAVNKALSSIPGFTSASVSAPGADMSKAAADRVRAALSSIPGMTRASIDTLANLAGANAARNAVNSVNSKTVTITTLHRNQAVADGGLFAATDVGLLRAYAGGGFHGSFRNAQPQIRTAGGPGVLWAEDGAGPWEGFVSGHPAKRKRSRAITAELARRLGGYAIFDAYADGGIHAPRYAPSYSPPARVTLSTSTGSAPPISVEAIRAAIDGATLRLGSIDPITHQVKAQLVTEIRRA